MILYLGTSSLVKLYVDERFSDVVREWVQLSEIVATCRITYTETISAFENRLRNRDISKHDHETVIRHFTNDWNRYAVMDFDEREAGRLVKKYGLRRFDAMHLSAALMIKRAQSGVSVYFSSADERLNKAATGEGLRVISFI